MLTALYTYFSNLFSAPSMTWLYWNIELFGQQIAIKNYFASIASLISLVFIFVLCCLFVWKIIKLIGGLIR